MPSVDVSYYCHFLHFVLTTHILELHSLKFCVRRFFIFRDVKKNRSVTYRSWRLPVGKLLPRKPPQRPDESESWLPGYVLDPIDSPDQCRARPVGLLERDKLVRYPDNGEINSLKDSTALPSRLYEPSVEDRWPTQPMNKVHCSLPSYKRGDKITWPMLWVNALAGGVVW